MRIHIGSDHAGLEFKNELIEHLVAGGHDVMITQISVFQLPKRFLKMLRRLESFSVVQETASKLPLIKLKELGQHWSGASKLQSLLANITMQM
jgi:hypothetical protein